MTEHQSVRDPLGAVIYGGTGGQVRFSFVSRGDRVYGRVVTPPRGGRYPFLLVTAPDGRCENPFVEAAMAAWSGSYAVATLDLPLCGRRRSDKLTAVALNATHPLGRSLRADLESQLESDLTRCLGLLGDLPQLDPANAAYIGVGLGADLARRFCLREPGLAAIVLAPQDPSVRATFLDHRSSNPAHIVELPPEDSPSSWLEEVAKFLDARLTT